LRRRRSEMNGVQIMPDSPIHRPFLLGILPCLMVSCP
jgi:hypothetical protein